MLTDVWPLKISREFKQQQRRQLWKHDLKSEFTLLQILSHLFHLVYCIKCWQLFLELNSKGLYQSSGKEKDSCCLVFLSLTKRKFGHFHIVVVQQQQINVQESVMHVQSCVVNQTYCFFLSPSSLLKLKHCYNLNFSLPLTVKPVLSGHPRGMLWCPLNTGCPPNTGFDI